MQKNPQSSIQELEHGQSTVFQAHDGGAVTVSYHRRQSYGDNGSRVSGAYTGEYTIQYPSGRTTTHEHGPHATTESAAKRGANPGAKAYAARQATDALFRHLHTAATFHDRRR